MSYPRVEIRGHFAPSKIPEFTPIFRVFLCGLKHPGGEVLGSVGKSEILKAEKLK